MLPPRMAPRQEILQYHSLFFGDASRTNQSVDILCALLDHRSLAGEVWMSGWWVIRPADSLSRSKW